MEQLLPVAISAGLAVSLVFTEAFGLAAGGMVVPGYVALYLTRPLAVVMTLGAGLATYLIVHLLSSLIIVYGRRRTVLMILIGYLLGALVRLAAGGPQGFLQGADLAVIGFIIPGLIAIWIDRQGIVETFASLLTAAVVVRLVLILFVGSELGS